MYFTVIYTFTELCVKRDRVFGARHALVEFFFYDDIKYSIAVYCTSCPIC